jgi:hypothetical protein
VPEKRQTIEQWLYELQRPGAELTLQEIIALDALLRLPKKTIREWAGQLALRAKTADPRLDPAPDSAPITLSEAALLAGITANDNAVAMQNALGHLEAMFGAVDEFLALSAPGYQQARDTHLARVAGRPELVGADLAGLPPTILPERDDEHAAAV